jgi:hypothetical protein
MSAARERPDRGCFHFLSMWSLSNRSFEGNRNGCADSDGYKSVLSGPILCMERGRVLSEQHVEFTPHLARAVLYFHGSAANWRA